MRNPISIFPKIIIHLHQSITPVSSSRYCVSYDLKRPARKLAIVALLNVQKRLRATTDD